MFKNINLNRQPSWSENLPLIKDLTSLVVTDYQDNFSGKKLNLASFTDADTRATRYRYFLQKNNLIIDGVDQYQQAEVLYVISPHSDLETKKNPAWEIASFVDQDWVKIGEAENIFVYRVEKN